MVYESATAKQLAELLLQIKAIELRPKEPFTWASGLHSPIYCDNRVTLSHIPVRNYLREQMSALIEKEFPGAEVIAGVATGGIALAALVAQDLNLPMVYVRSKAKGHGRQNLVEGHLEPNARVVVIEDLISTGGSSLTAVEGLRNEGAQVLGMAAIFTYAFQRAEDAMKEHDVKLFTLSDYHHLIQTAEEKLYIPGETADTLKEWRESPQAWSESFESK